MLICRRNFFKPVCFQTLTKMSLGNQIASLSLKLVCVVFILFVLTLYLDPSFVGRISKVKERLNLKVIKSKDGSYQILPVSPKVVSSDQRHLQNDTFKQYDLRIIAIVYNRAQSLLRLLNSLNNAKYDNDKVKLEVWIDRSADGKVDVGTEEAAHSFIFLHGDYGVYAHPSHVGIFGQWLSTWKPQAKSSEIAVILEDDLTVSPYFYKYLKLVHNKYDSYPHINGFALQGVSIKHSGAGGYLKAPEDNVVFMYPVVGTWGFSPSKNNWITFLEWFSKAYHEKDFKPYVPGNIVTNWYQTFEKSGRADGVWSMWFIYYAWKNNEYSLYSNFGGNQGLTTNWKEAGLHYAVSESKESNPLLQAWKPEYEKLHDKPVCLDMSGGVVKCKE